METPKRDTRKLSLYGLTVEEAITLALQVEPPPKKAKAQSEPAERAPRKKRVAKPA